MSARFWVVLHLFVLVVPALGLFVRLPDVELFGVVPPQIFPSITRETWADEQVQPLLAAYVDEHVSFHGVLVRTDNTLGKLLSHETWPNTTVAYSPSGVHFQKEDLWYATKRPQERPPADAIRAHAALVADLQRLLEEHGKRLAVILAPAKSSIYGAEVPDPWRRPVGYASPADAFVRDTFLAEARARGARVVDARAVLASSSVPREQLYAPLGRHWTEPGACLALKDTGALPFQECPFTVRPVDWRGHPDFDLDRLANIWHRDAGPVTAPTLDVRPVVLHPPPRVLFVGSSFTWMLADALRSIALSSRVSYYYETFYDFGDGARHRKAATLGTPEWKTLLLDADVYVLELLETYVPAEYATHFLTDLRDALSKP